MTPAKMNAIVARFTAFDTLSALVAACATGWVPTLRTGNLKGKAKVDALELVRAVRKQGYNAFDGSRNYA